jgi:signal transduction histidine kinase
MIAISTSATVIAGAVLALVIAGAAAALYFGLKRAGEAALGRERAVRDAALVEASPAQAVLVRSDGRVEVPQRVIDWLGLVAPPRFLTDLSAGEVGLSRGDADVLSREVTAAAKAGRPFRIALSAQGSSRKLIVSGTRAPDAMGVVGGVALWFSDATDSEAEIERLAAESENARFAFDALAGLIEAAPMPMWYRDSGLALTMVNTAYVRAVEGRDARDVIDRGLELVDAEGIGGPLATASAARDSGRPQEASVPATIGGARRMLRIHDVPLPTGGVAGYAVDVEELEQARGGIKRFGEAQRAMLDRLSAGVAHFAPDRVLLFWNQPFQRLFALRDEWLNERPEFDRILERMREAGRLPETRDFPNWKVERRNWFRSAGETAIEEAWHLPGGTHLRVVAQPMPDGGLLIVFEDRTEQVQLASARDTLLRVRTATFDNLFEAVGVFATDGRLQSWNQKFRTLWGFDEDVLNRHPRVDELARIGAAKLETPTRASAIGDLVRSATIDRLQRGGRFLFADGRTFEFAAVPLPDGNALFTMLDITDSRRIEKALRDRNDALEASDRVKNAFVANMSYELRTPLTSIRGFTEMLHEGFAGPLTDDGKSYTAAILEAADRLSGLVDDVLDLSRDAASSERVDLDVAALAKEAALTVRADVEAKELQLAVDVDRTAGRIKGDPKRLQHAVEHLLRHAIDATPARGRVLLHCDGTAKEARIVVSDNGPGMSKAAAARAFERFAQQGMSRNSERALGLGLPIAKQSIEAHGGTIALVSEPGEGTLITIELPRG